MHTEMQEYEAESNRMDNVFASIGINASEKNNFTDRKLVIALSSASEALSAVDTDCVNSTFAVADLHSELQGAHNALQSSQTRLKAYKQQLPEYTRLKHNLMAQNDRLMAHEDNYDRESSKISKSTLFHSKKKTQYSTAIHSAKKMLEDLGYEDGLSHESLSAVGGKVRDMEDRLKIMRLTLKSYKDLPPSIQGAQIALEEKKAELLSLEAELTEKLGNVAMTNALGCQ